MVVSSEIMKSRKKLATDLRMLQDILYQYFPTADISSAFERAMTELRDNERIPQIPYDGKSNNLWGYSLSRLIFKFEKTPRHTFPETCKDLKLILDIKAAGDSKDLNTSNDPLKWLEFNILIEGTNYSKDGNYQLITSFHLDRHIHRAEDGESEYPHPLYHFQFGGRKLKELGDSIDTGSLLVFDSPRIAHFPMEAILGIDFVLSNFFPKVWKKMKTESNEYINLIQEYQDLILRPYIQKHASQWEYTTECRNHSQFWNPIMICPQLLNS